MVLYVESNVQDVIGLVASKRPSVPVANVRVVLNEWINPLVGDAVPIVVCKVESSDPAAIYPPLPRFESDGNVDDVIAQQYVCTVTIGNLVSVDLPRRPIAVVS